MDSRKEIMPILISAYILLSGWYMLSGVKDSMAQEEEGMRQSWEKGIEALQTVKTHTWVHNRR